MSLLDENIIGLEEPKGIIALMRSWAFGGDYWQQKRRTKYESCSDKRYLMELSIKYYQYTREEREWMDKNDIKHMPWSTPSGDATAFTYGYIYSSHVRDGRIISKNYVQCSYPILDEISLRLVRDNNYHHYPFIIHDYDGEYLPDFIKFVVSNEYVKLIGDDKIYSDRMNKIRIYLDNCPNLKQRKDEEGSIVFIRLSQR